MMREYSAMALAFLMTACGPETAISTPWAVSATPHATQSTPPATQAASQPRAGSILTISLGEQVVGNGLSLDEGGDADTTLVSVGDPVSAARRTGTGRALTARDGNLVEDFYMQFDVDDDLVFAGQPTTSARIEVEFFDQGTDRFMLQYDASGDGGPLGNGTFQDTYAVIKANSLRFRTAVFSLRDIHFADRDNGADFRIADGGDGFEIIRRVTVVLLPMPAVINVDSCGANPWDDRPDSQPIQSCIDAASDGDIIAFTSGIGRPGYRGYLVDRTIFLAARTPRSDMTFTSTDPGNHALLQAAPDLMGFVVRLFARSRVGSPGNIDNITLSHLTLDGGRDTRTCSGADQIGNGVDDNWGSWLPECSVLDDPWCSPGTLAMAGAMDSQDPAQDYQGHPWEWSTGIVVEDIAITNTECGTALAFSSAGGLIHDSTIDSAGEHTHAPGCLLSDADEPQGGWADGITLDGPGHLVVGNTILDASDIAITHFGGRDTVIADNIVRATQGYHGMFAGIMIGPVTNGDISNNLVVDNQVVNGADSTCGGIHAGIVIGPHMWGAGCRRGISYSALIGSPNVCIPEPLPPNGAYCLVDADCQIWAFVAPGATFTLAGNFVAGAQINYLIEGIDLSGSLVVTGNTSGPPRWTDWGASRDGCEGLTWGPLDRVAHHPSLTGWEDLRVHCER
jgi:hypothetical protein